MQLCFISIEFITIRPMSVVMFMCLCVYVCLKENREKKERKTQKPVKSIIITLAWNNFSMTHRANLSWLYLIMPFRLPLNIGCLYTWRVFTCVCRQLFVDFQDKWAKNCRSIAFWKFHFKVEIKRNKTIVEKRFKWNEHT